MGSRASKTTRPQPAKLPIQRQGFMGHLSNPITVRDNVLRQVESARDELLDFAAGLIRIPSVNPPGACYRDCARFIGQRLAAFGFDVDYPQPPIQPADADRYPRVNVIGIRRGRRGRPLIHVNGHFDVVPPGQGWSLDPFGGVIRDGRLYGRGSADMKAGLACAIYAAEALRRAGADLAGSIEISGTVDEESGGFAGMGYLAECGRISAQRTDWVIIPEPFGADRICIGHRGVYWFSVVAEGRTAHGSMPGQGISAIDQMGTLIEKMRTELTPSLKRLQTAMPVVPPEARYPSINVNAVIGGQAGEPFQTPCVADRCEAIFDRRFVIEEGFEAARQGIIGLLDDLMLQDPSRRYRLTDRMTVEATQAPADSALVVSLQRSIGSVLGKAAELVASPGTYDQKHVTQIGKVNDCVAYGPGILEQAHRADEWCGVEDIIACTKVIALTLLDGIGRRFVRAITQCG